MLPEDRSTVFAEVQKAWAFPHRAAGAIARLLNHDTDTWRRAIRTARLNHPMSEFAFWVVVAQLEKTILLGRPRTSTHPRAEYHRKRYQLSKREEALLAREEAAQGPDTREPLKPIRLTVADIYASKPLVMPE